MSEDKKKGKGISDEMRQRLAAKAEADARKWERKSKIASIVIGLGFLGIGVTVLVATQGGGIPIGAIGLGLAILVGAAFGVPVTDFIRPK